MKKVVLITGCSSGIGFLAALKFAREGNKVYASVKCLEEEGSKELEQISKKENLPLKIVEIDITNNSSVEKGVDLLKKEESRVDILINNAGFGYMGPVETFTLEEIQDQYETNVFGTFRMIKAVVPLMRNQRSGLIINVSSVNGLIAFPYYGVYSSSKYAIESLTESLRFELASFGIKVALVEPGAFFTNFTMNRKFPKSLDKEDSPYNHQVNAFFRKLNASEEKGKNNRIFSKLFDPQRVASLLYKISQQQNPKLHNKVGIDTHIYYYARKLFPEFIWQLLLKKAYN